MSADVGLVCGTPFQLERISIEVTNTCDKACWFCYNHSQPEGQTRWTVEELVSFCVDCAAHGVKAVSLGGGEPLQYPGLFEVLGALRGVLFRSMTSNGLLLDDSMLAKLVEAAPDKVHLSLHFPGNRREVQRVVRQAKELQDAGIRSGINFLVSRERIEQAVEAAASVRAAGIGNERIVYLPMRGRDTPTPRELARVAGQLNFQSMTCLLGCAISPRFCAVGWDKQVAWCSYTESRRPLPSLTYQGLRETLSPLGLVFCG